MKRLVLLMLAFAWLACSGPPAEPRGVDGGATTVEACPDKLVRYGSNCIEPGVPREACERGFEHDGRGCAAIVPPPCPPGEMALQGETCHPIVPCPVEPWGGIPEGERTVYVDGKAVFGLPEAGTPEHPYRTLKAALEHAPNDAIVALAPGEYRESAVVEGNVQIWGRCPSDVDLVKPEGDSLPSIWAYVGSHVELHRISVRGGIAGVLATAPRALTIEDTWIHDVPSQALWVLATTPQAPPPPILVKNSLFERVGPGHESVSLVLFELGRVAIDGVVARAQGDPEANLSACITFSGVVADATLDMTHSRVEGCNIGLDLASTKANVKGVLVQSSVGTGIQLSDGASGTFESVVVDNALGAAFASFGSEVTLNAGTLRGTQPLPSAASERGDGLQGVGIWAQNLDGPSHVSLNHSVVDGAFAVGIAVIGSRVDLRGTWVREIRATANNRLGDGASVFSYLDPAELHVSHSRIENAARAGISNFGGLASLDNTSFECSAIDLNGEDVGARANFDNRGGNRCGCGAEVHACQVLSENLEPPSAIRN